MKKIYYVLIILLLCLTPVFAEGLVGKTASEISATSWINSEQKSLSSLKGKPVVFYFWTTWFPECKTIAGEVNKLYTELSSWGIEFISLTSEQNRETVKRFVQNNSIRFPIGLGSDSEDAYDISMIPYFLIIDPLGVIAWEGSHYQTVKKAVKELGGSSTKKSGTISVSRSSIKKKEKKSEKTGREAFLEFLKKSERKSRTLMRDASKATEFFANLQVEMILYLQDKKVVGKSMRLISKFLNAPDLEVRTEAVKLMGMFENNQTACSVLCRILVSLARKSLDYKDYQIAVIDSIASTGKYYSPAPQSLFKVLESPYNAGADVKNAALTALGKIRTYNSVDSLVRAIAKLAPDPEEPYDTWGDDKKGARWDKVAGTLYSSLEDLTGQSQIDNSGVRFIGRRTNYFLYRSAWGYSTWKKWALDNKAYLIRKFRKEQKEEQGKK